MKSFSIVVSSDTVDVDSALTNIAEAAEDNHYWLDANAVIKLSAKADDENWVNNFRNMLRAVEAYGYSDLKNKRVKAHVEIK